MIIEICTVKFLRFVCAFEHDFIRIQNAFFNLFDCIVVATGERRIINHKSDSYTCEIHSSLW